MKRKTPLHWGQLIESRTLLHRVCYSINPCPGGSCFATFAGSWGWVFYPQA